MCSGNHCCCVICYIPEQHVLVMHEFGKYQKLLRPGAGLVFFNCITQGVAKSMSLMLRTLQVIVTTKTKDHTFMIIGIDIQYQTLADDESVYKATYYLTQPQEQMRAYVEDVVRTTVNKLTLDEVYREKSAISDKVKENLNSLMGAFGFQIVSAPITRLDPEDNAVLQAMNRVLELDRSLAAQSQRNEQLMNQILYKAEAEQVAFVESGKGLAAKRAAIVDGLRESVASFSKGMSSVTPKDVLELILMTQYFDMLKDISSNGNNTLFVSHGPSAVADISRDIRKGFAVANESN